MTLAEAIAQLYDVDEMLLIAAKRPWAPTSEAKLVDPDPARPVPPEVKAQGYDYFLEIHVAREQLEGMPRPLTEDEKVRLLIYYAENDAFPDWI